MVYKFNLLILCFLVQNNILYGQESSNKPSFYNISLLGYSGLLYTPNAYTAPWGNLYSGFTHFDKNAAFTFEAGEKNERSFIANLGFLPFAEFTLRLTKPYNSRAKNYGIGDRSISGRIQLLKEKKYLPAILIGTNDLAAVSSFFNTNYIVFSKTLHLKTIYFNSNIGYGVKLNDARRHYLQGVFGGVQARWRSTQLLIEYDADQWNIGTGYTYKQLLYIKAAFIDMQHFSFNIGLQFSLR